MLNFAKKPIEMITATYYYAFEVFPKALIVPLDLSLYLTKEEMEEAVVTQVYHGCGDMPRDMLDEVEEYARQCVRDDEESVLLTKYNKIGAAYRNIAIGNIEVPIRPDDAFHYDKWLKANVFSKYKNTRLSNGLYPKKFVEEFYKCFPDTCGYWVLRSLNVPLDTIPFSVDELLLNGKVSFVDEINKKVITLIWSYLSDGRVMFRSEHGVEYIEEIWYMNYIYDEPNSTRAVKDKDFTRFMSARYAIMLNDLLDEINDRDEHEQDQIIRRKTVYNENGGAEICDVDE